MRALLYIRAMRVRELCHGAVDWILAIGAHPGEPEVQRGKRRIFMVALLLASTFSVLHGAGLPAAIRAGLAT